MTFQEWDWEITTACNLSCLYCLVSAGRRRRREIDGPGLGAAVRGMRQLGARLVRLTGGEPLCHPRVFEALWACRELGLQVGLLTNGTLVDGRRAARLAEVTAEVGVSVDSLVAGENAVLRGEGSLRGALEAILRLAGRVPVVAHLTVTAVNLKSLGSTVRGLRAWGAAAFRFSQFTPAGRGRRWARCLAVSRERAGAAIAEAMGSAAPPAAGDRRCWAGRKAAFLGADGLVFACSELALRERWRGRPLPEVPELPAGRGPDVCPYELRVFPGGTACLDTGRRCRWSRGGEGKVERVARPV